jgi:hypothetical protein
MMMVHVRRTAEGMRFFLQRLAIRRKRKFMFPNAKRRIRGKSIFKQNEGIGSICSALKEDSLLEGGRVKCDKSNQLDGQRAEHE